MVRARNTRYALGQHCLGGRCGLPYPQPMRVPMYLFVVSVAGAGFAATRPGLEDLALIAGLAAVASLVLLLDGLLSPRRDKGRGPDPRRIVVDGSNVMYWKDNTPSIVTLVAVVQHLERLGYRPGVVFDANAGYLVAGGYRNGAAFAQMLGLPRGHVLVVPKGTPADAYILASARDAGLRIVSNDRYRDWQDQHPEIRTPGRLIRGGWANGAPWVEIDAFAETRAAA
jgi:Zc3h12a-like Ribonuclease NYN domain